MVAPFDRLRPAPPADVDWLVGSRDAVEPGARYRVAWTVPAGHDAVRRVLPPLGEPDGGPAGGSDAERTDRPAGRRRWDDVLPELTMAGAAPPGDLDERFPADATVGALIDPLVELLRPLTSTPDDCTFATWIGWGWNRRARSMTVVGATEEAERELRAADDRAMAAIERFVASCPTARGWGGRDMFLCRGRIGAIDAIGSPAVGGGISRQMPQVWWPADHAWVVAHEIDEEWVYVGGGHDLVARIADDPVLESVEVTLDDRW